MKTAREIKEKYQSITEETCEGYQDEHILQAMEEYADNMAKEIISNYKDIVSDLEEQLSHAINAAGEQEQRAREAERELRNILHEMRRGAL